MWIEVKRKSKKYNDIINAILSKECLLDEKKQIVLLQDFSICTLYRFGSKQLYKVEVLGRVKWSDIHERINYDSRNNSDYEINYFTLYFSYNEIQYIASASEVVYCNRYYYDSNTTKKHRNIIYRELLSKGLT